MPRNRKKAQQRQQPDGAHYCCVCDLHFKTDKQLVRHVAESTHRAKLVASLEMSRDPLPKNFTVDVNLAREYLSVSLSTVYGDLLIPETVEAMWPKLKQYWATGVRNNRDWSNIFNCTKQGLYGLANYSRDRMATKDIPVSFCKQQDEVAFLIERLAHQFCNGFAQWRPHTDKFISTLVKLSPTTARQAIRNIPLLEFLSLRYELRYWQLESNRGCPNVDNNMGDDSDPDYCNTHHSSERLSRQERVALPTNDNTGPTAETVDGRPIKQSQTAISDPCSEDSSPQENTLNCVSLHVLPLTQNTEELDNDGVMEVVKEGELPRPICDEESVEVLDNDIHHASVLYEDRKKQRDLDLAEGLYESEGLGETFRANMGFTYLQSQHIDSWQRMQQYEYHPPTFNVPMLRKYIAEAATPSEVATAKALQDFWISAVITQAQADSGALEDQSSDADYDNGAAFLLGEDHEREQYLFESGEEEDDEMISDDDFYDDLF